MSSGLRKFPMLDAAAVHFGQCIQAALIYRSALFIFLVTESFSYAGFIAFWYYAAQQNPTQNLYTGMMFVAYFVVVSFHHAIQDHASSRDIGSEIRLGKLSYAIVRPFPYLLLTTLRSAAFSLTRMTLLTPLLVVALVFVPGLFAAVHSYQTTALFWQYPLALVLSLVTAIATRTVIGFIAFDMNQIWGPDTMFIAIYFATSGSAYPIDLAPEWLRQVAAWSPAYYMAGFPALVFLGKITPPDFLTHFSRGILVFMITVLVAGAMWRRGMKRFEAIGI